MKLIEYLHKYGLTHEEGAKKLGIAISTFYKIYRGDTISMATAMKVFRGSGKQITPHELFEEIEAKRLEKAKSLIESYDDVLQPINKR